MISHSLAAARLALAGCLLSLGACVATPPKSVLELAPPQSGMGLLVFPGPGRVEVNGEIHIVQGVSWQVLSRKDGVQVAGPVLHFDGDRQRIAVVSDGEGGPQSVAGLIRLDDAGPRSMVGSGVRLRTLPNGVSVGWGELADPQGARVPFAFAADLSGGSIRITVDGARATLRGDVGGRLRAQIEELARLWPAVRVLELENIPGGRVSEEVLQACRRVRELGWATTVPDGGVVSSAGVMLFVAGRERAVASSGKLGVHAWRATRGIEQEDGDDVAPEHEVHDFVVPYFEEMLPAGADFYRFCLAASPYTGMHTLSREELRRFGLVTRAYGARLDLTDY